MFSSSHRLMDLFYKKYFLIFYGPRNFFQKPSWYSNFLKKLLLCSQLFSQRREWHLLLFLGTLIACHGYFYAIDEHVITLKDDNSFNRFQSENYWPSKGWEPDQSAYAIYLIKRSFSTKVFKMIKINMLKVLSRKNSYFQWRDRDQTDIRFDFVVDLIGCRLWVVVMEMVELLWVAKSINSMIHYLWLIIRFWLRLAWYFQVCSL